MVQYIERIDGHVMFWYQLWIKNNLEKKLPISKRGIKGDLNLFLFRHSEERLMRRENLIHPRRHSEERLMRRENLIL